MTEFEIPRGAERGYLIIYGVAAVYIATMPAGEPCLVEVSRDLDKSLTALRREWPATEISCAFWVKDRAAALEIAEEVNLRLPQNAEGWLAVRVEAAVREIVEFADDQQIQLTTHTAAMERVRWAIDQIEARIRWANATGELCWFNRAYRSWRLEARKAGRSGFSYNEALARLRNEAIKQLITLGVNQLGPGLLSRVLPPLPEASEKNFC
jgi:hypothetical protein